MANEARVQSSLVIRSSDTGMDYRSNPTTFLADVANPRGPKPGLLTVTPHEVEVVSFSPLTTPALCRIQNLDPDTVLEYGVWDAGISKFFPLGEVQPGESYVIRLSRNLGKDYVGTGTVSETGPSYLGIKCGQVSGTADHTVNALVEAFDA